MNVLGISAHYHDASAAVVSDGQVIAAAAEERFTLQKHDPSFPRYAIEFCLHEAGIAAQDLDEIVFYEEPHTKFTRVLSSTVSGFPFTRGAFVRSMSSWIGSKLWVKNEISRKLDVHPRKIRTIPHHVSHAAQAFAGSPFSDAAILVVDAVGEWGSTSLFRGEFAPGLRLTPIESIPYPHSLGLAYAAFTAFLGFKVNDGECSTMALATFGTPIYADDIRRVIQPQRDGTYRLDPAYFTFDQFRDTPFSSKFVERFGQPRSFKDELPFDCLRQPHDERPSISAAHQRFADIAASVQLVLEEALLGLCRKLHAMTGAKALCFSGGVALNCVANTRLLRESPFEDIFVPPDPGDGGAAIGAALYSYYTATGQPPAGSSVHPYLGQHYDEGREADMLAHVNPDHWVRHRSIGRPQATGMRLDVRRSDRFEQIVGGVVDDLQKGKIVGWFQGRFENGPRALGNRSILIDPQSIPVARRLSRAVKARAPYRPYALSMTAETAATVLTEQPGDLPRMARWMQMTWNIRPQVVPQVAAAIHVDGTTRPQVCRQSENPRYHALLTAYGQASGTAALLNTSFNDAGFPIVSSPAEALIMFARTDLDTLVVNDLVVRKVHA